MSEIKVNTITKRTGSTLTLGESGTTVALAAGASSSGFISDSDINWQAVKTADFTAVAGEGYFVSTAGGAITVTLPASPSIGDTVMIVDMNNAATNNITIARNGSNISAAAANRTLTSDNQSDTLVFSDATRGWQVVTTTQDPPSFISATGGTATTSGNYKIHTFTSSGNFVVDSVGNGNGGGALSSYLVIAGGGGGGGEEGGGGGAGGFREGRASNDSYTVSPLNAPAGITLSAGSYPITVGAGGTGQTVDSGNPGGNGSNSVFSTITSTGGGKGAGQGLTTGSTGGSGGGGQGNGGTNGGAGNTPSVSPSQGNTGGNGVSRNGTTNEAGGGGGAAGAAGGNGSNSPNPGGSGGAGGAGATTHISGTPVQRAAGGGGGAGNASGNIGTGGSGGGGNGTKNNTTAVAGTANTGSGGGGGGGNAGAASARGGAGGSGIVIIRYKYQ